MVTSHRDNPSVPFAMARVYRTKFVIKFPCFLNFFWKVTILLYQTNKNLATYRESQIRNMNGSFFDKIGVADREKVHSAVIGWIFSDDCKALTNQQKSELLCSLFHVSPSQTFNSFVVEVEHHDIDVLIITDNTTCWVIENKIKSSQHSNQLDKYYKIVNGEPVKIGRKIQNIQDYKQFKSHYCFLTLVNEKPQCTNNVWVNTTYKSFSIALKNVLANVNSYYVCKRKYQAADRR